MIVDLKDGSNESDDDDEESDGEDESDDKKKRISTVKRRSSTRPQLGGSLDGQRGETRAVPHGTKIIPFSTRMEEARMGSPVEPSLGMGL